jgi:hypothetical protein
MIIAFRFQDFKRSPPFPRRLKIKKKVLPLGKTVHKKDPIRPRAPCGLCFITLADLSVSLKDLLELLYHIFPFLSRGADKFSTENVKNNSSKSAPFFVGFDKGSFLDLKDILLLQSQIRPILDRGTKAQKKSVRHHRKIKDHLLSGGIGIHPRDLGRKHPARLPHGKQCREGTATALLLPRDHRLPLGCGSPRQEKDHGEKGQKASPIELSEIKDFRLPLQSDGATEEP